eukprot:g46056.t1
MDSRFLWQGLTNKMGYEMKRSKIADKDTLLPEALNAFYAQFKQNASSAFSPAPTAPDAPVPFITTADVRTVFLKVNTRKAMGPDSIPGRELRSSADRLVDKFTDISKLSILQAEVPTCFKKGNIIPVPKKAHATCRNDHYPMALTSIIMKYVERLVTVHINPSLPDCLNPLQFAYQCNRSTVDSISLALLSSLEHLDNKDACVRLLLKERRQHAPSYINREEVERFESNKFLGAKITDNLSWTSLIDVM